MAQKLLDPFETELTLAPDPRVLSLGPRSFEIPMEELLRHLSFDLVGAIPRQLGALEETLTEGVPAPLRYALRIFHLDHSVLALATEIEEADAEHRVLELLGVGEDVRVRVNMTRLHEAPPDLHLSAAEAVRQGRSLGQVRIWANDQSKVGDMRRTISRQLHLAGVDSQVLGRDVREPTYRPPAAGRLFLDALPGDDLRVADLLLGLLAALPAEGAVARSARRIGSHHDRVRKGATSIVSFFYEIHRAATGVLHVRRREVEAGVERPGLVRTFNVAGLRGAARLRIRDVGGRASAEFAGAPSTVAAIRRFVAREMGGRA